MKNEKCCVICNNNSVSSLHYAYSTFVRVNVLGTDFKVLNKRCVEHIFSRLMLNVCLCDGMGP